MEVREASVDDTDEMVRLAAIMFASIGADPDRSHWRRDVSGLLAEGLASGRIGAFVVDDPVEPGRLAASAAVVVEQRLPTPYGTDGRIGYVQWVCTDPAHRRRGLGRAVMDSVLAWTHEQGLTRVELHASPDGQALYEELGFQPTPPSYRFYHPAS